jgi:hypothetical protein
MPDVIDRPSTHVLLAGASADGQGDRQTEGAGPSERSHHRHGVRGFGGKLASISRISWL